MAVTRHKAHAHLAHRGDVTGGSSLAANLNRSRQRLDETGNCLCDIVLAGACESRKADAFTRSDIEVNPVDDALQP